MLKNFKVGDRIKARCDIHGIRSGKLALRRGEVVTVGGSVVAGTISVSRGLGYLYIPPNTWSIQKEGLDYTGFFDLVDPNQEKIDGIKATIAELQVQVEQLEGE